MLKDGRKHYMDDGLAHSFNARYLIHLVGDIHQPLHGSSYYGEKFPNSDRGGNSWKVNYPQNKEVTQLHALWDSCVDQYGSIWTPIKESLFHVIEEAAANLTQQYTR